LSKWEGDDHHDFQRECLSLIANFVADWRHDVYARVIFANLLVVDPSDPQRLKVIARDREGMFGARLVPEYYPREGLAVAKCFAGDLVIVDDLRLEFPTTHREKQYRSILGIPLRSLDGRQIVGALSIDSSEPCHFRKVSRELEWYLQPYIKALEVSLDRGVTDYAERNVDT
jgi:hypothetical protein